MHSSTYAMPDIAAAAPSKTELKRRMHDLQQLGVKLAELPDERLRELPLDEALREALHEFDRTRSHEARRRQMQYIGRLMRQADAEPIREAVAALALGSARDTLALHAAERSRDELLASDGALARWIAEHPASDADRLRSLVHAARRDAGAAHPPGAALRKSRTYRDLFQFIRQHHDDKHV